MRKFRLIIGVLVMLLATAGLAAAKRNGTVAVVRGSPTMTIPLSEFNPDLEGDAEMQDLTYHIREEADGTLHGEYTYRLRVREQVNNYAGTIICMKVDGNRAWIGATVDETDNPAREGLYSWWQIADNGNGGPNSPDMTTFLGFGSLEATIAYCEGPEPNFIFQIQGGNITVNDLD